ncbi:MAG: sigma-70 family RNA polymerase sigma factor, partial [Bacteroidales bacterium]|nr:sigma-70 family RNA polymerase sigma factor [Candidatus Minthousia equi]
MNTLETTFTRMVKEQKSTIYTVCLMFSDDSAEVDDLVQQTLINLWKGFENFQGLSD